MSREMPSGGYRFIMASSIFCPFCQRKNKPDATHCVYCGVQFTANKTEVFTTQKIADTRSALMARSSRCAEHLATLPEDGLVLFVMNAQEPIILESVSQVILGRDVQDSAIPYVDLTPYGALERGVSRQHVQITLTEGAYTLVDLGSTNGTWLNQGRLIPGKSYQLHSSDQISLGQLRITTCFHADEETEDVVFYVRDATIPVSVPHHLTPQYIAVTVVPFLQAIIELQELVREFRGQIPKKVDINALSSIKRDPTIIVSLSGATETVGLLQKWVTPWRKDHVESGMVGQAEVSPQTKVALKELGVDILSDLMPDMPRDELENNCVRLLSPLSVVALSDLLLIA